MQRLETGVPGLDTVLGGGVPRGSLVLVGGPPGAGKTILSTQIAFNQARLGKRTLMLTALSEANVKLIVFLDGLEYFDQEQIGSHLHILNIQKLVTEVGLDATLAELRSTVVDGGFELLIIDSFRSLQALTGDEVGVQRFIFGLTSALFLVGCTTLLVEDQPFNTAATAPQQAISDTILLLDVVRFARRTVRQVEVVKLRGGHPLDGRHSMRISNVGIRVYPRIESLPVRAAQRTSGERQPWGVAGLDAVTGGGVPLGDSTLVLGPAGAGKTTLCLHFAAEGLRRGEGCVWIAAHETREQLALKGDSLGIPLAEPLAAGALHVLPEAPGLVDVDEVLQGPLDFLDRMPTARVVIDPMDPLERDASREGRSADVIAALVRILRSAGATTLITHTLPRNGDVASGNTVGSEAAWDAVDNALLLLQSETDGDLERILVVRKMRISDHGGASYSFDIGSRGMEVGAAVAGLDRLPAERFQSPT